jgi:hypothetical protein
MESIISQPEEEPVLEHNFENIQLRNGANAPFPVATRPRFRRRLIDVDDL